MFGAAARHGLLRLAIPRRVCTQNHIDYAVEAIIVEQPPSLRHFSARFRAL